LAGNLWFLGDNQAACPQTFAYPGCSHPSLREKVEHTVFPLNREPGRKDCQISVSHQGVRHIQNNLWAGQEAGARPRAQKEATPRWRAWLNNPGSLVFNRLRRCQSCGTEVGVNSVFCPHCGASLDAATESHPEPTAHGHPKQSEKPTKNVGSGWKRLALAFAVISTILVVVIAILLLPLPLRYGPGLASYNVQALQSQIAADQKHLASNMSAVNSLSNEIATLQGQIGDDQSTISGLQNQVSTDASQLFSLQSQIASLQYQIQSDNSQITSLQNQLTNDQSDISALQGQVANLNSIVSLSSSTTWVNSQTISQPAGYYTYWAQSTQYAGYVTVDVQSSSSSNTYAIAEWSANGVTFSQTITVGYSGTAAFPVLPASSVRIGVGNNNFFNSATETVTITYYY
jgi:zinc-ribbon domain